VEVWFANKDKTLDCTNCTSNTTASQPHQCSHGEMLQFGWLHCECSSFKAYRPNAWGDAECQILQRFSGV